MVQRKSDSTQVWGCMLGSSVRFHSLISVSGFVSVPCSSYYSSSVVQFEIEDGDTTAVIVSFGIVLFYSGYFMFS